jgi:hypothetical protein
MNLAAGACFEVPFVSPFVQVVKLASSSVADPG